MYQYLTNVPLDRAVGEYLALLKDNGLKYKEESLPVFNALNRITSRAVYARICAPHYNACAMDGIALNASLTFGATETTPVLLDNSQFTRVDTGDPLPTGCDCVIMIEDVLEEDQGIKLLSAAVPWQHIRQIGEDICAGDMILPSFSPITPSAMGAMLASGILELLVVKLPIIGIIPTGDEIVSPCENPKEGDIIEFNSTIFSAMLSSWGAAPKTYPIVKDKFDLIIVALEKAAAECDAVIINAGSSAGREDYSANAIREIGGVLYHGIAIKPGKPAILGYKNAVPILGVPGYPVSGIIVLESLMKPIISELCKTACENEIWEQAELSSRLNSSLKYREFVRTRLGYIDGKLTAVPLNRGAGVVTSFVKADGIIDVGQNIEVCESGEKVPVKLMRPLSQIKQTLNIVGSHDPLIDEAADLMRIKDLSSSLASSHVGSMGAIMAIKRNTAHVGGIHLLNEADGSYNISYIKKYFPAGGVTLLEGVKRIQGLMVAKGNPKGIKSLEDVFEKNLSFVNRQKGSGTRILLDYMLKNKSLSPALLYGYEREEFTHTGVAAQISGATADIGLGILSAAKIYDLDFIPLCHEEYDLLIANSALELDATKAFLDALKSSAFIDRLEKMGGYSIENIGSIKFQL